MLNQIDFISSIIYKYACWETVKILDSNISVTVICLITIAHCCHIDDEQIHWQWENRTLIIKYSDIHEQLKFSDSYTNVSLYMHCISCEFWKSTHWNLSSLISWQVVNLCLINFFYYIFSMLIYCLIKMQLLYMLVDFIVVVISAVLHISLLI